ncbi:MAG: hypothetical protein ABFD18_08505, partial [Syntrophomonas sp.]
TLIPDKPCPNTQSRSFPQQLTSVLASFAASGFKTGNNILAGIIPPTNVYPPPPLKAGYTAPSFPGMQVFCALALKAMHSLHEHRGHARMPLRIAPIFLTPSNDP